MTEGPGPIEPKRRRLLEWFLRTSIGGLFASIFYPIFRFLSPPRIAEASLAQVDAGPVNDPDLLDRGFKIVRFGAEPVILVRLASGEFRAFAATCTHLQCIVEFRKPLELFHCNCHNGEFDLTGRNISGPPPRPLAAFAVHVVTRSPGQPSVLVLSRA